MEPYAVAAVLNAMATADVAAVLLQVYALAPHLIGPPGIYPLPSSDWRHMDPQVDAETAAKALDQMATPMAAELLGYLDHSTSG
eukprot:2095658-Pyramimonas_sp.AAC.1